MPYIRSLNPSDTTRVLFAIDTQLRMKQHVIVSGMAGVGKTTILQMAEEDFRESFDIIRFLHGYEINNVFDLEYHIQKPGDHLKTLFIIDGYDIISDNKIKETILRICKEGRKYNTYLLMSSRERAELSIFEHDASIFLLEPLHRAEALDFLMETLEAKGLPGIHPNEALQILRQIPRTLREIMRIVELIEENVQPKDIITALQHGAHYDSPLFGTSGSLIIQPEQKQIITNTQVIQQTLLEQIGTDMPAIFKLSPRKFEQLVAELFEKEGFQVELTQETRDNGKDIILTQYGITGKSLYYVECKRYSPDRKVSVGVIQRLHGTVVADRATKGIIVTTSSFSDPAIREVRKIEHQISLMDHVDLYQSIQKITANR